MRCPRCEGLMFEERFQDLRDDMGQINFHGWRCSACGEVIDPVILGNRGVTPKRKQGSGVRERYTPFVLAGK